MQDPSYAQVHQGSVAGEPDLLDSLFDALDVSDKGYLEVPEMKRLGLVRKCMHTYIITWLLSVSTNCTLASWFSWQPS
jgi:hypothetical protein